MRIFSENISFCFPNARNTCRRSRHRHTARRYAVFLQQSPKNSTAECLGSIALCLLHGQKTPPAIRKTANWPAPTYTLTTKSFANASTRIFSKKRSGNFPNTFYCFSIKINIFAKKYWLCRIFSAHTRENTALRCSNDRSVKFHDTSHATKHGFKGEIEKAHENIMTLTLESLTMPAATDGPTHIIKEKSRTSQCRIKQKK